MAKKYLQIRDKKRLSVYDLDGSLANVRDEITSLIEEYGEDAYLDFWSDNYGDEIVLDVHFNRVESDKERDKRLSDAKKLRDKKAEDKIKREADERAELARLQEKYNG